MGYARLHRTVGTHAHKQGIVLAEQLRQRDILTHLAVKLEANAHRREDLPTTGQQRFIQLKSGNAEGKQAANLRVAIKDRDANAAAD